MSTELLVFLITVGAVALFVVGMSLTLILKGRNIDSEIGENKHMKRRGIVCTARQFRKEEAQLKGDAVSETDCNTEGCSVCGSKEECTETKSKN